MDHHHQQGNEAGTVHPEVTIDIVVGAEQHQWHHKTITYEEVVGLLFPQGVPDGAYPHSISFSTQTGRDGQIHKGQGVDIEKGMKFYVRSTHKS